MGARNILRTTCPALSSFIFFPVLFLLLTLGPAQAGTIVVKPGKLDHFVLTAPETAVAGESFLIRIDPYDANGNLIAQPQAKGSTFNIKVSGGAEVTPDRIRPMDFAGGITARVFDKVAETIVLQIVEGTALTPLAMVQIPVYPNKLDHFDLSVPKTATSGESFQCRIIARDAFGNTKIDLADIRPGIQVEFSGSGSLRRSEKALPAFRSGEMILSFEPIQVGKVKIAVQETTTHSRGESSEVEIKPAYLDHFILQGPKAAVAGEKFTLTFSAMDKNENLVTNYGAEGDGVLLLPSGEGLLDPPSVGPKEFRQGQAKVKVSYTAAGSVRITAREVNSDLSGESESIVIVAAEPNHFIVGSPAEAVAGEAFPIEISALDRYNNLITDYDLRGLEVYLSTDGTGQITPSSISPSAFTKGKATLQVSYSRAESFSVIAALSQDDLDKIIRERSRREEVPASMPTLSPEEVVREREREEALKAREEALKARMEVEEEEKIRQEALKAREEAQRFLEEEQPTPPLPTPPPLEVIEPEPETEPEPREELPPAPGPERVPLPEPLARDKPEPVQVARRSVQELEQVSFIESKGQAMIMLETSGPVSYNASTGSALSKEWIYVELFPVQREKSKVSDLIRVESSLVGDVLVEEVVPDKIKISLQILPPGVSYIVSQQDRAVVVKIIKND